MKKLIILSSFVTCLSLLSCQQAKAFLGIHLKGSWEKGTNSKDCACCGKGTCKVTIDVGTNAALQVLGTADNGDLAIGVKQSDLNLPEIQDFIVSGNWYIGNTIQLSSSSQNALASQGYNVTELRAGSYRAHIEGEWVVFDLGIPKM